MKVTLSAAASATVDNITVVWKQETNDHAAIDRARAHRSGEEEGPEHYNMCMDFSFPYLLRH